MTALACVAYGVIVLWAARRIYGRWRARLIDTGWAGHDDPVARFNQFDRTLVRCGAVLAALALPAALTVWAMCWWLERTPIRSRAELAAERDALAARIRDLERNLGITP